MTILSHVWQSQNLRIGRNTFWHRGCYIDATGGVSIGKDTIIGPYVVVHSANHKFYDCKKLIRLQGHDKKHTRIGNDCWIGAHAVILPGVSVEDHSVVGAGSVVTKNVPAWSVVAGNPAKVIKSRRETS